MFEQEIEMEKKESSIVPLLLMVVLIVGVVGVALYFVAESRRVLTTAQAAPVILASFESQGPPTLRFQTGDLSASANENAKEPHYRLLEKGGYIKIGKEVKEKTPVTLTPEGQALLAEIAGVKKSKTKDDNEEYVVPLAQRKLVEIGKITMITPNKAAVEYTWKWEPNKLGDLFDVQGATVQGFNTWDRGVLIDKWGADYYHADSKKAATYVVKTDKGWGVASE